MKPEYKERVLSNIESIGKRVEILTEMIERKRPSSDREALQHLAEIRRLLDSSDTVVSIS